MTNNDDIFFKIWRNKYIKLNILNQLKSSNNNLFSYSYDNIISTSWMIKYGYYSILKEKVINSEYLVFNSDVQDDVYISRNQTRKKFDNDRYITIDHNSILFINNEKAAALYHWDYNFYKSLFSNYSNYFINNENLNETEFILIEYDNSLALDVLVNEFNLPLNLNSFYRSFEIGSYNCSIYILNKIISKNKESNKKIISNYLWNNIIFNYKNNKNENINQELIFERIDFVINKCNCILNEYTIPKELSTSSSSNFNPFIIGTINLYDKPISYLLKILKLIINLNSLFKPFIKSINQDSLNLFIKKSKSILLTDDNSQDSSNSNDAYEYIDKEKELNEFNNLLKEYQVINSNIKLLFKNTGGEFKLPELDKVDLLFSNISIDSNILVKDLNRNGDFSNELIENVSFIYRLLLPFSNHYSSNSFLNNFNFYKLKFENNNNNNQESFLNFNYIDNCESSSIKIKNRGKLLRKSMFGYFDEKQFLHDIQYNDSSIHYQLFLYCSNDRKLQCSFINQVIQYLKNGGSGNKKKLLFNFIIEKLIKFQDIEMLELIINLLNKQIEQEEDSSSLRPSIKELNDWLLKLNNNNIQLFDYFYNLIYLPAISNIQINQNNISRYSILSNLLQFDKPILLNHFKDNYKDDYYKLVNTVNLTIKPHTFNSIKFVYDNLQDYKFENVNTWRLNPRFINNQLEFQYLIEKTPITQEYYCPLENEFFYKYLLNYRIFDLKTIQFNNDKNNDKRCLYDSKLPLYTYFKIYKNHIKLNNYGGGSSTQFENYKNDLENLLLPQLKLLRFESIKSTLLYVFRYGDTVFLDMVFDYYLKNKQEQVNLLYVVNGIFDTLGTLGDLKIFKYLSTKYSDTVRSFLVPKPTPSRNTINKFYLIPNPIKLIIEKGHIDFLLEVFKFLSPFPKIVLTLNYQTKSLDNNFLINYFKKSNNFIQLEK